MSFFKRVGDSLVLTAFQARFAIPNYFFVEPKHAEDFGNRVRTMFIMKVFIKDAPKSKEVMKSIFLPADLNLFYDNTYEEEIDGTKYQIYEVNQGTRFVDSIRIIQTANNMRRIFDIITKAQLKGIPYERVVDIFFDTASLNKSNPGATPVIFEALISELARYKKDMSIPFRIPYGSNKATQEELVFTKIKDIPKLNSTFGGIGFENITTAVQSGLVKALKGENEAVSPLEEVSRY